MIKVSGERGLVRDPYSKAILNTDVTALQEHRRKKTMLRELYNSKDEIHDLKEEVSTIKQEMSDIKMMLEQLLTKLK